VLCDPHHAGAWRPANLSAADDCALESKAAVGRRGVAGTVLVHKCAGAAAAAGASLAQVLAVAEDAAERVGTMGASLTECTPFGRPRGTRLGPEELEMGLGIHGEPGAYRERVRWGRGGGGAGGRVYWVRRRDGVCVCVCVCVCVGWAAQRGTAWTARDREPAAVPRQSRWPAPGVTLVSQNTSCPKPPEL
jgi:hypothetical protein